MGLPWTVQQKIYTAFCGLGFVLAYIPFYWHLEASNIGAVLWMFWSGTGCLVYFINGIVWHDSTTNCAPVWCDITTRFMQGQPIGTTVASLLINHRLYRIFKASETGVAPDRRKMMIIDLSVGLGVPVIFMGTYWFVQGHRFDIVEGFGCIQAEPLTYVWIFTYGIWPSIIIAVSGCFGVLSIRAFFRHRRATGILPGTSSKHITSSRYFRLMLFASVDVLLTFPLTLALLYNVLTTQDMYPYAGLADLHFGFDNVVQVPAAAWRARQGSIDQTLLAPGTAVASVGVFFAFFGLSAQARAQYAAAWAALRARLPALPWPARWTGPRAKLPSEPGTNHAKAGGGISHLTMPSFVQRPAPPRPRRPSDASTLSVCVTVEGHVVSDAGLSGPTLLYDEDEKALADAERALRGDDKSLDEDDKAFGDSKDGRAPRWPPGLAWLGSAPSPATPASRLTRPPSHSFHGPRSVTGTWGTLGDV
ncbi:STE3 domain-containing protein [Phanerochaete sordida]|uniref:STE3 domain-containing protein n=1 Tax=Phanerochaete sordida TaxID=48140 RepID=A0A9P3GIS0_9APHY|nr:STE3 domain-containing protein [Phanerochaete sordida]